MLFCHRPLIVMVWMYSYVIPDKKLFHFHILLHRLSFVILFKWRRKKMICSSSLSFNSLIDKRSNLLYNWCCWFIQCIGIRNIKNIKVYMQWYRWVSPSFISRCVSCQLTSLFNEKQIKSNQLIRRYSILF